MMICTQITLTIDLRTRWKSRYVTYLRHLFVAYCIQKFLFAIKEQTKMSEDIKV